MAEIFMVVPSAQRLGSPEIRTRRNSGSCNAASRGLVICAHQDTRAPERIEARLSLPTIELDPQRKSPADEGRARDRNREVGREGGASRFSGKTSMAAGGSTRSENNLA